MTEKKESERQRKESSGSLYTGLVPAVDQAMRILVYLAKSPSPRANLTEICKNVGIHKSKGYSILNTLQKYGFVQRDPNGKQYSLGLGLISLSRRVLDNLNYSEVVLPFLEDLSKRTKSTALFGLINGDNLFIVAKEESEGHISVTIRIGYRFNLTHGAHGKAIAAFLPEDRLGEVLNQKKLYFYGDTSRFDLNRLQGELERCRKTGYAVDIGELNPGINVIASPVFDHTGEVIGSIFIMGTFKESMVAEYGPIVLENAVAFSSKLGANIEKIFRRETQE